MAIIANNDIRLRLTIRISRQSMSFSVGTTAQGGQVVFEPYELKTGMSIAANLREAFSVSELLQSGYRRVLVLLDAPVMLVPTEELRENDVETLFSSAFQRKPGEELITTILPDLNAAAVFAMNKDLKMVIDDHFKEVRVQPVIQPVWTHLHQTSYANKRRKLYAYFHHQTMEVFGFQQHRFRFNNSFQVKHAHDALYFLLFAWKQLGMNSDDDEVYIVGTAPHQDWFTEQLKRYLRRVYVNTPEMEFKNMENAANKQLPYDLKALYLG